MDLIEKNDSKQQLRGEEEKGGGIRKKIPASTHNLRIIK